MDPDDQSPDAATETGSGLAEATPSCLGVPDMPSIISSPPTSAATSICREPAPEAETVVIDAQDITERDILIKDKCLVDGNISDVCKAKDALQSNEARNESYYSKLIDRVTRAMLAHYRGVDREWDKPTLMKASLQIVKSVQHNKRGRFIWLKQLRGPDPEYVVLSLPLAAQKVTNDIRCHMRLLKAQNNLQTQTDTSNVLQYQHRLKYGKQLIAKVYTAEKSGLSPMQAARTLDDPVIPDSWSTNGLYEEPEEHRRIRLQLRQRYLALARTNASFHDFSMAMIAGWSESEAMLKKRFHRKGKSKEVIAKAVIACAEMMNQEGGTGGNNAFSRSDLPPSFPTGLLGSLGSVVINESKKIASKKSKKKTDDVDDENADSGETKEKIEKRVWSLEERAAMLQGLEEFLFGNWASMHHLIPTR